MHYTELIKNNGNFEDMFWSKNASEKKSTDSLHVKGGGSTITNAPPNLSNGKPTQGTSGSKPGTEPAVLCDGRGKNVVSKA